MAVRPPDGRTPVEAPFAAAACGVEPHGDGPSEPVSGDDIGLWWALVDRRVDVDALLGPEPGPGAGPGPLWPLGRREAIEVWTEAELSGLHALWALARQRCRDDWARRARLARDWHLLNTQPDNATNRPWALHVFVLGGTPEARHYAETLLHNAMVGPGRPDLLSAWILLDAARWLALDSRSGTGPGLL